MGFPATVFELARQGAKKVFVANLDVTAASIIVNFVKAACEGAGVEFVGSVTVPSAAPDMAPYVAAAQDAGADAVVTVLADPDAVKYMKAAQQVGAKFQFAHTSVQPQGKITEGMAEAGSLPPMVTLLKAPEGKEYLKAMKAHAKGLEGKSPGRYFQPFMYGAWNAIQAVKQVVEFLPAGADITGPAVLEGFNTIPELDLGVVPPFKPAGPGPVKVFPRITNTYEYLITIKNNQQVLGQKDPINIAEKVDFAGALSG
jgi:ABC-type branched-subunit amino acid transport system substrate-binding protein